MKNMRIATLHSLEKDLAQGTMKDAQDLLDDFLQKEGIIPEHSYHIVENLVSDSSAPVYEALLRDASLGRFDLLLVKSFEQIAPYALSLTTNSPLLKKLKADYGYQNILFIGCSLDDEVDLKALSNAAIDFQFKDTLSRTIIFIKGQPSKLQKSKFKTYGITDVVCFDSYDAMYKFLFAAWEESTHIADEELEQYSNVSISHIRANEIDTNRNFFFWGKGLLDLKQRRITYPYFFISRDITDTIIQQLAQNKIHLIYGGRVSGKSYLLADVYSKIRDRTVIFLDGKSRLSENA